MLPEQDAEENGSKWKTRLSLCRLGRPLRPGLGVDRRLFQRRDGGLRGLFLEVEKLVVRLQPNRIAEARKPKVPNLHLDELHVTLRLVGAGLNKPKRVHKPALLVGGEQGEVRQPKEGAVHVGVHLECIAWNGLRPDFVHHLCCCWHQDQLALGDSLLAEQGLGRLQLNPQAFPHAALILLAQGVQGKCEIGSVHGGHPLWAAARQEVHGRLPRGRLWLWCEDNPFTLQKAVNGHLATRAIHVKPDLLAENFDDLSFLLV